MKKRVRRISTLGSRATSLVSIGLVLLLLGMGFLVGISADNLRRQVKGNVGFVVVMERECPLQCVEAMKKRLHADPAVDRYSFTSAEAILEEEAENLGEDILAMTEANPYSSEFEVRLRDLWANSDSVEALASRYAEGYGVDDVVCENETLKGVDMALRRVAIMLGILALVLLIVSIGLINNTVSLSVYGRRFTIHAMKLVGATPGFIRRPFVLAAAEGGLLAGAVSGGMLLAMRWYAGTFDASVENLLPWSACITVAAGMALTGAAICALTGYFASRRYLRASYDEMFMK